MRNIMNVKTIVMTTLLSAVLLAGCENSGKKETKATTGNQEKTTTVSVAADDNASAEEKATEKETQEAKSDNDKKEEKSDDQNKGSESETFEITENNILGAWEYKVGSEYTGMILEEGQLARFLFTDGTTMEGRWNIEDGILKVRLRGGMESFNLGQDKLIATDGSREYLKVEKLASIEKTDSQEDNSSKDTDSSADSETIQITEDNVIGAWEYKVDSEYTGMILEEGQLARFLFTDGTTMEGRWNIEDGILKVRLRGGMESFNLGQDKLIATDGSREYLKVEKLANIEKTN